MGLKASLQPVLGAHDSTCNLSVGHDHYVKKWWGEFVLDKWLFNVLPKLKKSTSFFCESAFLAWHKWKIARTYKNGGMSFCRTLLFFM